MILPLAPLEPFLNNSAITIKSINSNTITLLHNKTPKTTVSVFLNIYDYISKDVDLFRYLKLQDYISKAMDLIVISKDMNWITISSGFNINNNNSYKFYLIKNIDNYVFPNFFFAISLPLLSCTYKIIQVRKHRHKRRRYRYNMIWSQQHKNFRKDRRWHGINTNIYIFLCKYKPVFMNLQHLLKTHC